MSVISFKIGLLIVKILPYNLADSQQGFYGIPSVLWLLVQLPCKYALNYEAYPIPKTKELDGIKRIVETIKEEYAPTEEAVEAREEEIQKEAIQEPEGRPTFADTLRIIQENQLTEEKIQDEIEDILQSVQPKEEKEEVFQEEESPSPKILFFFES
jgi:hypothetical protein